MVTLARTPGVSGEIESSSAQDNTDRLETRRGFTQDDHGKILEFARHRFARRPQMRWLTLMTDSTPSTTGELFYHIPLLIAERLSKKLEILGGVEVVPLHF